MSVSNIKSGNLEQHTHQGLVAVPDIRATNYRR